VRATLRRAALRRATVRRAALRRAEGRTVERNSRDRCDEDDSDNIVRERRERKRRERERMKMKRRTGRERRERQRQRRGRETVKKNSNNSYKEYSNSSRRQVQWPESQYQSPYSEHEVTLLQELIQSPHCHNQYLRSLEKESNLISSNLIFSRSESQSLVEESKLVDDREMFFHRNPNHQQYIVLVHGVLDGGSSHLTSLVVHLLRSDGNNLDIRDKRS
jgi:hypothetical protein